MNYSARKNDYREIKRSRSESQVLYSEKLKSTSYSKPSEVIKYK
ncbi:hypothetical protein AYI69_g3277, partial [Smittium culicis]